VTGRVEAGESSAAAASRELFEETGIESGVVPLDYRHAFAWGEGPALQVIEETAYAVEVPRCAEITLDPQEHTAFAWRKTDEALGEVPYAGLREAIRRATRV
jgi:8-oxo-dGTP diphosphatase